jgi:hypothetical protein
MPFLPWAEAAERQLPIMIYGLIYSKQKNSTLLRFGLQIVYSFSMGMHLPVT